MGKLDKLKSQIPQGSQELSTKNHLAKTEIAMSFQNEGTELTRILLRNIEFNPHNLWSCNDDDESIRQLADAIERNGLLHNIVVSQREDGTFMLLSGERRVKALRLLQKREQESDPTGQKAHKWDRVQAQTYTGLDELSELIILDEANIMVRGLSGDAKTIQACISRYLDNLQAKFQVDRRAAEAYFKSRTQMTDSTVQRYTQFDKSLIDDVKEFFQNGTISHAQALSLCPLEPSEQVLYVNAINKAIQMSNGDKALEHTYVTRITDRAAQAARMTNGREDELARLEEAIISPVHAKPAGDVAVRTQKATLIRKYEKVTFDLSKITSSKRPLPMGTVPLSKVWISWPRRPRSWPISYGTDSNGPSKRPGAACSRKNAGKYRSDGPVAAVGCGKPVFRPENADGDHGGDPGRPACGL